MKVIVGLGNPGKKYEKTRHNIGFMIIDNFLIENNESPEKFQNKFNAHVYELNINTEKVLLIKPQSYMNLSGQVIAEIVKFYKLDISKDVLIIYDDKDVEFNKIKLKYDSSHGGHNGMRNIIDNLKTQQVNRIKVGVGSQYNTDTKNFVLGKFSKDESAKLEDVYKRTNEVISNFIFERGEYNEQS